MRAKRNNVKVVTVLVVCYYSVVPKYAIARFQCAAHIIQGTNIICQHNTPGMHEKLKGVYT